jgi:hypothetical protein
LALLSREPVRSISERYGHFNQLFAMFTLGFRKSWS